MQTHPPEFIAVVGLVLDKMESDHLVALALYATWPATWEARPAKSESWWNDGLSEIFRHPSGQVRMTTDIATIVGNVANNLLGKRQKPEQKS